jgi:acyl-coenzyme A synthetase/AMP-(fatty) acid ligase
MDSVFVQHRDQIYKKFSTLNSGHHLLLEGYFLGLFQFQYKYNDIYRDYCNNLGVSPSKVLKIDQIPYLPISAFKHYEVKTGTYKAEEIFYSSGTTSTNRSHHHVRDLTHYLQNTALIWQNYFGPVAEFCFLALLPGYLEREGSSLISMVDHFIKLSKYAESGFYLRNHDDLYQKLLHCKQQNIPTVLFGVPYALLDYIEQYALSYPNLMIVETGGMKGKREEMPKEALHEILKKHFGVAHIYSEYGMTEILSQAYTKGDQLFQQNQYFNVTTHQINDPLSNEKFGKSGILCIADAANIDSCAFIQTEDMGRVFHDGTFEILGRLDISDIRGCNLLVEELGM